MPFKHGLQNSEIVSNQKIQDVFKCSSQGGMRRAHRTNTLVIVSDYTKAIYEDRWINNIFPLYRHRVRMRPEPPGCSEQNPDKIQ